MVVANNNEIRLWDFYDHSEEAPELITAMQISEDGEFKVENVFINKNSKSTELFVLVTCKNQFVLYTGRLEVKFKGQLDDENEYITSAAFTKDSAVFILGTSQGKIVPYRISDGQMEGNPI